MKRVKAENNQAGSQSSQKPTSRNAGRLHNEGTLGTVERVRDGNGAPGNTRRRGPLTGSAHHVGVQERQGGFLGGCGTGGLAAH